MKLVEHDADPNVPLQSETHAPDEDTQLDEEARHRESIPVGDLSESDKPIFRRVECQRTGHLAGSRSASSLPSHAPVAAGPTISTQSLRCGRRRRCVEVLNNHHARPSRADAEYGMLYRPQKDSGSLAAKPNLSTDSPCILRCLRPTTHLPIPAHLETPAVRCVNGDVVLMR